MKNEKRHNLLQNIVLNVLPDIPDIRDRIYEPALAPLGPRFEPFRERSLHILDQGEQGACTGFALSRLFDNVTY